MIWIIIKLNPKKKNSNKERKWYLATLLLGSSPQYLFGFTEVPLSEDNFVKQRPYNVPLNERYSFDNGVRRLWVYSSDKPFKKGSETEPRTEIRMSVSNCNLWIYMLSNWQVLFKWRIVESTRNQLESLRNVANLLAYISTVFYYDKFVP